MAARKRKKSTRDRDEFEPRPARRRAEPAEEPDDKPTVDSETEDEREFDLDVLAESRRANEPDPRAVDNLTDRIFGSVLSRFGWERHGNRIEHVGEERSRR